MILVCDHRGEGLERGLRPLQEAGFELEISRSLRETRERMSARAPALVVLDPLSAGGQVELEQVERLRGDGHLVPVLLVCDRRAPLPALEAARSLGDKAWDLIYRDAPLEEFRLRIERLLGQVETFDELDELRYRASHDDRTELLRPRVFQARLCEHFSAAQRHELELAFVLIDLDDFGQVNKEFDHTVGDLVITRVGEAIKNTLRAEDVAGRLGGDEFAVVLPYTSPVDAARAVQRLCQTIHALTGSVGRDGRQVGVSASLGFETTDGRDLDSVHTLRHHAELALRQAKRAGGNAGVYYRSLL